MYILNSEEIFFLNDFTEKIKKIIPEDLKDLNQYVFYGNEIKADDILLCAKKFPMIGNKQLIIVKNGNKILKEIDKIISQKQSIPESPFSSVRLSVGKISNPATSVSIIVTETLLISVY